MESEQPRFVHPNKVDLPLVEATFVLNWNRHTVFFRSSGLR